MPSEEHYVMAIDQGTTSTRSIIFNHDAQIVASAGLEHRQILPKAGWVEHDPIQILDNMRQTVAQALAKADISRHQLAAIGITNQRETTLVWDRHSGQPVYNAIVWQDLRTAEIIRELAGHDGLGKYRDICGLDLSTYFSGPKLKWLLDNVDGMRKRAEAGDLLFGNIDSWLIWNLSGGVNAGVHITDVTNASRTMLMDIHTLSWREDICSDLGIPLAMLPQIKSSSQIYGYGAANSLVSGVPIAGDLGDQQAASFGQACFEPGMAKNTYGTGCFMLLNTGRQPVSSSNGLLTTLAFKIGDQPASYALEGSIAVAGSLVQWLRDQLGLITSADEIEQLAASVADNGGVYFVPAFSGLFAPYWRDDARGLIVGLTRYNTKAHLARAGLEATAFQTAEVLQAMNTDLAAINNASASTNTSAGLTQLRVDGAMTANSTLMQFQADLLNVDVIKPVITETTALGAAYAAGIAVGFWNQDDVAKNWRQAKRWRPQMSASKRQRELRLWKKAVSRSLDWVDEDVRSQNT